MGLLLGIVAAFGLGTSDFFAGRAGRTEAAISVTRTALLTASLLTPLYLLLAPFEIRPVDLGWGALSGVFLGAGLVLLYEGYRSARVGVVGPASSILSVTVPLVLDLVRGEKLAAMAWIGLFVGVVALGLTTYVPGGAGTIRRGLILGVTSGLLFGVGFALMALTSKESGLTPVSSQRIGALVFLAVLGPFGLGPFGSSPFFAKSSSGRRYSVSSGMLAGLSLCALQVGFRSGSISQVSVAVSQFATVTVVLAAWRNRERLYWWQLVGVALAAVGVGMMAAS